VVPVGQDQVQHVEFARGIARKFNSRYGRTFPECPAKLTKTARILGLDGESKMSKSQDNYIALLDPREMVWKKLAPAKTDPARARRTDPGNPEICNIFSYHKVVTPEGEQQELAEGCRTAGIGCLDCKKKLLGNLMKVLDPIQERYQELSGKRDYVRQVLDENGAKCRKAAAGTIVEVKEKMGLNPVWKI